MLDRRIEPIFVAPERERVLLAPGPGGLVDSAQVAAGGKGAVARRGDQDAGDRGIVAPCRKLRVQQAHHAVTSPR